MTILSFLLLWTILKGAQTLTISPSWLEKWVFHGSSLLAQLHQKWLKLWGLLTLQSPESNLWRDLLQWPTQSMYHYHLTSLWTVLTVFSCLYVTERRETLKPRFCSWNSAGNQKLLWKKTKKQTLLKHAGYYFRFLLSHPLMLEWVGQCVWVCTYCVSLRQQALELLGPSAVQACWNVIVLILYFQRCFRAYEKISFMFL